ncbi:abortive phage infection AIPR family protein [Bifidobacterium adolescentis]|nr:AIPR family protein [Bifidobacterium adolescentis]OSH02511.1 abortive phage infection AIPR family protein [Bifidobacterium adolescentis]
MKLVVVGNEAKEDLIPDISRYTNSQNKVAEADFSSNSDYQVKLQQLSQQIFTPMINGAERTHWYYERTRGQYDNEKNRFASATERKRFEKLNPRKQRIKMVDAPKYLVCWDQKPYVASLGAQKCFAIFAKEQSKNEHIDEELDQEYFEQLVCKRIIFDTLYKRIKQADWYRGAYQANITEYAIAKYSYDLSKAGKKMRFCLYMA